MTRREETPRPVYDPKRAGARVEGLADDFAEIAQHHDARGVAGRGEATTARIDEGLLRNVASLLKLKPGSGEAAKIATKLSTNAADAFTPELWHYVFEIDTADDFERRCELQLHASFVTRTADAYDFEDQGSDPNDTHNALVEIAREIMRGETELAQKLVSVLPAMVRDALPARLFDFFTSEESRRAIDRMKQKRDRYSQHDVDFVEIERLHSHAPMGAIVTAQRHCCPKIARDFDGDPLRDHVRVDMTKARDDEPFFVVRHSDRSLALLTNRVGIAIELNRAQIESLRAQIDRALCEA